MYVEQDLQTLLLPILSALYNWKTTSLSENHLYILLIVLLMLTQDTAFVKNVHTEKVPHVPWYTERHISNVPLGSLLIAVLLKVAYGPLASLSVDLEHVYTNSLAAVGNLAPQVVNINAVAA